MTRFLAKWMIACLVLTLLLSSIALSPIALPFYRWALQNTLPDLSISELSGSLSHELEISELDWGINTHHLNIKALSLSVQWSCLFNDSPCALNLGAQHIAFVHDDAKLRVNTLTSHISKSGTGWRVSNTKIQNSDIQLLTNDAENEEAKSKTTVKNALSAEFVNVVFSQITVRDKNSEYNADLLQVEKLNLNNNQVQWYGAHAARKASTLVTSGGLSLSYPHTIDAVAEMEHALGDQTIGAAVDLTDNLVSLSFEAQIFGAAQAELQGKVNLFQQSFPLEAMIKWPKQDSPVPLPNFQAVDAGKLSISGNLDQLSVKASTGINVEELGNIPFIVDGEIYPDHMTMNITEADNSTVDFSMFANVNWEDKLSGTGRINIQRLSWPNLKPLSLDNGRINFQFAYPDEQLKLLIDKIEANGTLVDRVPLIAQGRLAYDAVNSTLVGDLDLANSQGKDVFNLTVRTYGNQYLKLDATLSEPTLSLWHPSLQGKMSGSLSMHGDRHNPSVEMSILANGFNYADTGPTQIDIKSMGALQTLTSDVSIDHSLLSLNLSSAGRYFEDQYQIFINSGVIESGTEVWKNAAGFNLNYDIANQQIKADGHCWDRQNDDGRACINQFEIDKESLSWMIAVNQIPLSNIIKSKLSHLSNIEPLLTLSALSEGTYIFEKDLIANASISLSPSTWTFNEINPVSVEIDRLYGNIDINEKSATLDLHAASQQLGNIASTLKIPLDDSKNLPVSGNVLLSHIQLSSLSNISPSLHRFDGDLNGELQIQGTVKQPLIYGNIDLIEGSISLNRSPVQIQDWHQDIVFNGLSAEINGQATISGSQSSINGLLDWSARPVAELNWLAEPFPIHYENSDIMVSGALSAMINNEKTSVTGEIAIPKGQINIARLPENAVTRSFDVHVRGEPKSSDPLDLIDANIQLKIDQNLTGNVKVDAYGLKANLSGQIDLQTQPASAAYGNIQINDGKYEAYGQALLIRTGQIQFNGPIQQPFVLFEAIRDPNQTSDGVIAGIRATGNINRPNVSLFSEPAMSQSQNLMYLFNGNGSLQNNNTDSESYQAALLGLGLSRTGTLTNNIGQSLGIDNLTLATSGQGQQTQVAMTGQLNQRLSMRLGVGLFNHDQEIAIRYRLMPQLYIEAVQRLSDAVSLIDLYYQFSVGEDKD